MTRQFGNPDLPPEPDAAALRELTRFEARPVTVRPPSVSRARRYDQCDETCTADCGHCKGRGVRPERARDVPLVTDTGRRLINSQPVRPRGLDRGRRTPAVALVPVVAALCAVIALAAIGAAQVAVFGARHWAGAVMLVALGWALSLLIRGCRRGR